MRNFRMATIAGATAVAVAFGSTSVAFAEDAPNAPAAPTTTEQQSQEDRGEFDRVAGPTKADGGSSTRIGKTLGGWSKQDGKTVEHGADGTKIFGLQKDLSSQPVWAQLLYSLNLITVIGALIGLVAGPLYNFVVHGL